MAGRNNINLGDGEYIPVIRGNCIQGKTIRGDYVRGQHVDVEGDYVENTPPPSNGNPQRHQQNPEPSMDDLFRMTPQELQDYVNSVKAKYQGGSQQQPDRSGWTQYSDDQGNNYIHTNGGNYCEHIEGDYIQGSVINGRVINNDVWSTGSTSSGSNVWDDNNNAEPTIDVEATEVKGDNDSGFGGWLGGLWK
jgi:hypothetical protein